MTFGRIIKKMRIDARMTQEELASLLGISYQAVSHWENEISMPEISVVPKLADIFDVSADDILGIDSTKRDATLNTILNNVDKAFRAGNYPKAEEILRAAQRQHPRSYPILTKLAEVLVYTGSYGENPNYGEVITLCNTVIDKCKDNNLRNRALNSLAIVYYILDDHDEMMNVVNQLPSFELTREGFLVSHDGYTDQGLSTRHKYIHILLGELLLTMSLLPYHTHDDGDPVYSKEEQIALFKQMIAIIEILFPDGDYHTIAGAVGGIAETIAHIYLENGDTANGIYWLGRAAEYNAYIDRADFSKSFTSPVLKGCTRDTANEKDKHVGRDFLMKLLTESTYDSLRDDDRFIAVIENLKKTLEI